jgi:molecular chaperone GrpE
MADELRSEDETPVLASAEPIFEVAPDVAFVVPAPAYDSIVTDDELALAIMPRREERGAEQAQTLEAITSLRETFERRLDALQTLFEREIRAEETREKVVDRLHAELQEYKQDLLLNVLRPVFIDLIQFHDNIGKLVASQPVAAENAEARRLLDTLGSFQQEIEDILYRQGVEPFCEEGDAFDPRRQRAASTVPTDDPSLVKTIAARLRKGFKAGEKVIRPEVVSVYTLRR